MSFEIDAFMGQPPPPMRASQAGASAEDVASFDNHLSEAASAPEASPDAKLRTEETEKSETAAAPIVAPQPQSTDAAPMVIQLIASAAPVTPTLVDADAAPLVDTPTDAAPAPVDDAPPAQPARKANADAKSQDAPQASGGFEASITDAVPVTAPSKPQTPKAAESDVVTIDGEAPVAPPAQAPTAQVQAQAAAPLAATAPLMHSADARAHSQAPDGGTKSDIPKARAALGDAKDTKAATGAEPHVNAAKGNTAASPQGKDSFAAALAAQDAPEGPTNTGSSSAMTNAALIASNAQASSATLEAATAVARAAPVAAQVGREIIRRFNGESTFFELRLDPPDMGRIEVRLEVSRDHRVTAIVAADNPQALADLARHARDLEEALQSAGLQLSDEGLSFDLSQHRESRADAEDSGAARARTATDDTETQSPALAARPLGLDRWRGVRVDVMA